MASGKLKSAFNDKPSEEEVRAFIFAAGNRKPEVVRDFLDKYPHAVDSKRGRGTTALMTAAFDGSSEMVELLLKGGASVHEKDMNESTPLMHAALKGNTEAVALLLEAGSDLDAKDYKGCTALKLAKQWDWTKATVALLEQWQEMQKDIAGFSPALKRNLPPPRKLNLHPKT